MVDEKKTGPIGEFLQSQITPDNKGGIQVVVGTSKTGEVLMDFGKLISWLRLAPDDAKAIAKSLIKYSQRAEVQTEKIKH